MIMTFSSTLALLAFGISTPSQTEDWEHRLEVMGKECVLVLLGRITETEPIPTPSGAKYRAKMTIKRHLKGSSELRMIEVEAVFPSFLELTPDTEDVIWFVRKRLESGKYLITDWKWDHDSLGWIESAIARVDKTTRILGLPQSQPGGKDFSATIGADDGQGKAQAAFTLEEQKTLKILIQLENHGKLPHTAMPPLDGSCEKRRYPRYDLEVVDADGKQVTLRPKLLCGNINAFKAKDFVSLQPSEVLRVSLQIHQREFPGPGKYRLRIGYTGKRDLTKDGISGSDEAPSLALMQSAWEGTAVSNWIEVEVLSRDR